MFNAFTSVRRRPSLPSNIMEGSCWGLIPECLQGKLVRLCLHALCTVCLHNTIFMKTPEILKLLKHNYLSTSLSVFTYSISSSSPSVSTSPRHNHAHSPSSSLHPGRRWWTGWWTSCLSSMTRSTVLCQALQQTLRPSLRWSTTSSMFTGKYTVKVDQQTFLPFY